MNDPVYPMMMYVTKKDFEILKELLEDKVDEYDLDQEQSQVILNQLINFEMSMGWRQR